MCFPQEIINLQESSAVKKKPQDGKTCNKRETISAWKTVLRCLTDKMIESRMLTVDK